MASEYQMKDTVAWTLDNGDTVLGFQRVMGEEETEDASEKFAAEIEAAGWHVGEGMILDGVEFISLEHSCGQTMQIEDNFINGKEAPSGHALGFKATNGHSTVKRYNIAPPKQRVRMEYVCECGAVVRAPQK